MATADLPATGYVRLAQFLGPRKRRKSDPPPPIPMAYSTWHDGVSKGRLPPPVKLTPGSSYWRVEDIQYLIEYGRWVPKDARASTNETPA